MTGKLRVNSEFRSIQVLSRALAAPLFGEVEPFVQFWLKSSCGTILPNHSEFGTVVQEEISFYVISYVKLWQPLCSVE